MDVYVSIQAQRAQTLYELLNQELRAVRKKGLRVTCRKRPGGQLHCRLVESRLFGWRDRAGFRWAVARAVAVFIIQEWEHFAGRRLLRDAGWLDERDWDLVCSHLNENPSLLAGYRDEAAKRLAGYLEENTRLDVDGFVSFRLSDYLDSVGEIVGRILDDALYEQENREFISVLKQYTQRQKKPMDTVHVVILSGNRFRIYDDDMHVVTKSVEEETIANEDEVRQEDLLISALVTLAPRQVTIHGSCTSATYNTLAEVFPGALQRCSGCKYCPTRNEA
ncbi:MAG: putative sporulation protein YtxC [Candidatus Desulforudis sp.]|nr:putative sporulation protein YtxC [Desulforudis sp.]